MKKYNHGVSVVEVLLSIIIIGLVLIVLFNMLINVRKEDEANQIQSRYALNQSQFIQRVEEDLTNYGLKSVSSCDVEATGMNPSYFNFTNRRYFKCIKFEYASDYLVDNIGYLMIYNYNTKFDYDNNTNNITGKESVWMLSYTRGHFDGDPVDKKWVPLNTQTNEMSEDYASEEAPYVKFNRSVNDPDNVVLDTSYIVMPITNQDGEHYDINLSNVMNSTSEFICNKSETSTKPIECLCIGNEERCNNSIN